MSVGRPFVKVCGLRDRAAARAAADAGADWLGLVFAPSPRRVDGARARDLVEAVPGRWAGVFVDATLAAVERTTSALGLAAVQLHGRESPGFARRVREATGLVVWKAVPWPTDAAALEAWRDAADAVLLDAGPAGRGGTGRTLPWDDVAAALPPAGRPLPIILAGGLGPATVARAIEVVDPDGVDASSALESAPGAKSPDLVRAFVAAARVASAGIGS